MIPMFLFGETKNITTKYYIEYIFLINKAWGLGKFGTYFQINCISVFL